jgi:hypothetical protein
MTRDDIILLAKESGWKRVGHNPETGSAFPVLVERLERFAALVAAAEREACAEKCHKTTEKKYRRGDRLFCRKNDEYCVIDRCGTDSQYVRWNDGFIGEYTNEQFNELFELLPKEAEAKE